MIQQQELPQSCSCPKIPRERNDVWTGETVFVIAEAGVNHNGKLDEAIKLVEAAKRVGADAVKFQVFTADELVIANAPTAEYQAGQGHSDQLRMLRELELTRAEFVDLFNYCRDVGITFLATPFTMVDLEFLADLDVSAIKLASTDAVNAPLLDRAISSGLPIIASTGTCTLKEIDAMVSRFQQFNAADRLILMHCISSYPTQLPDVNLKVIAELRDRYGIIVGFSDHTAEWMTGALAVAAGAMVLEKHLTLDCGAAGPDHALSLDEAGFEQYVSKAHCAYAAMGDGQRRLLDCEHEVRRVSRGSVVAAVDIPAGCELTAEMLTVKRPGYGIEPARMGELIGLISRRDVRANTMLQWDMFQFVGSLALADVVGADKKSGELHAADIAG